MLTVVLMIACYWLLLSAIGTACFCWPLHTKRIQFHDPLERRDFVRMVRDARK